MVSIPIVIVIVGYSLTKDTVVSHAAPPLSPPFVPGEGAATGGFITIMSGWFGITPPFGTWSKL
jgi:hypothetical protein